MKKVLLFAILSMQAINVSAEKIKTENILKNCINQELKESWNATIIALHTCNILYHKKYSDIIFIT